MIRMLRCALLRLVVAWHARRTDELTTAFMLADEGPATHVIAGRLIKSHRSLANAAARLRDVERPRIEAP